MEKTIVLLHGDKIEVRTDGALFGFMADDIITDESANGCWRNKRIIVEGFSKDPLHSTLWGTVESEKFSMCTTISNGLILLERPGLKFKVGDDVVVISDHAAEGEKGKIIVLNPYKYHENYPQFLVELENFIRGRTASVYWEEPWYPIQHRTYSESRCWLTENDLEFLPK